MSGKNFMSYGDADTILTEFSNDIKSRVSTKANQGLTAQQIANAKTNIDIDKVPNVATNDQTPTFLEESTRTNIASGDKLSLIFGKIKKFFSDLKAVAFSGSYNDLSDTPDLSLKADKSLLQDGNYIFQFGVDSNGNYGYKKAGADTVIPFKTVGTRSGAITANGTYTAKTDISKDGYESVTVSVSPNLQSKTVTAGTTNVTVSPDASYDGLSSVVVQPTPSQTKSASSSTSAQTITPDSGKLLSSVSISAISPQRSLGTAATGSGIDSTGPYVYIPYGWWPEYSGKAGSTYAYLTNAQAVAACRKEEKTVTSSTSAQTVTPSSGYLMSKVTVKAISTQTKTVAAKMSNVTVSPDSGKLLSGVTVTPNVTSIWTNPSPNASFSTKDITISGGISSYKFIFVRFKHTTTATKFETIVGINVSNYNKFDIAPITNIGTLKNVMTPAHCAGTNSIWRPIVYVNNTTIRIERPLYLVGSSGGGVTLAYNTSGSNHGHCIPLECYGVKA